MERFTRPADIERESMRILSEELAARGIALQEETAPIVKRVIHATADFEFSETLFFSPGSVAQAVLALRRGAAIVTDTNMAKAGVSRPSIDRFGCDLVCYMADPEVAALAKAAGTTRAVAAMDRAAEACPGAILAIGNAPTALFRIAEQIEGGLRPALVIAVPVGFVNVVEGKRRIKDVCLAHDIPIIAAMGRKGGSTVCAAILNALLYLAANTLDPAARGW